ncbi:hypothetical protein JXL19_07885 [bacterium]|nr:hypothetical protein [bacterium]
MGTRPNIEAPDGLHNHFRRLINGDQESVVAFINAYKKRVIEIVIHDNLYKEYIDKLPQPEYLAEASLLSFADNVKNDLIKETCNLAKALLDTVKKHIHIYTHKLLKQICYEVYLKTEGAEEQLWQFEINVFLIIERLSSANPLFSDHAKVAKQVMFEFISQIKKNGDRDKKGEEIKDFPSYLYTIVKRRTWDQKNRDIRWKQFPESSNYNGSFGNPLEFIKNSNYESDKEDYLFREELIDILVEEIFPKLDFLERFIVIMHDLEDKTFTEIRREIYSEFRTRMDESTIWRKHKKAKETIKRLFCRMGIYNYMKSGNDPAPKKCHTINAKRLKNFFLSHEDILNMKYSKGK